MALFHLNERLGEPGSALSPAEPSPQQVVGQQTGRHLFKALAPLVLKPGLPFLVGCPSFFPHKQLLLMRMEGWNWLTMTAMHASFFLEILPECLRSGTSETQALVSAKNRLLKFPQLAKKTRPGFHRSQERLWSKILGSLDAFKVRWKIW